MVVPSYRGDTGSFVSPFSMKGEPQQEKEWDVKLPQ